LVLGFTATPERADEAAVLRRFDDNLVYRAGIRAETGLLRRSGRVGPEARHAPARASERAGTTRATPRSASRGANSRSSHMLPQSGVLHEGA
jgi:hypothetical protein